MKTNCIVKAIKSTIVLSCSYSCVVVRSRAHFLVGGGGDIYMPTAAKQSHLKIASVAICEILFDFLS